jgi:flagellar protein FlbD
MLSRTLYGKENLNMLNLSQLYQKEKPMILVTRFNNKTYYLNADLIRTVEATPDTVITLQDDTKVIIKETPAEIMKRFIEYQRLVRNPQLEIKGGE